VRRILLSLLFLAAMMHCTTAQEYFTIRQYNVTIEVNKDASLDVEEDILVNFISERHGIIRKIPYRYPLQSLPEGTEKADRQMESGGYAHTIIENIRVDGWNWEVNNEGDYKAIKIGSANKYVNGDQRYVIRYRMLNAINFFKEFSELYFNVIGNQWATTIDSVHFTVKLYEALPNTPEYFVATGPFGSRENSTITRWENNQTLSGSTTRQLGMNEGVTVGIRMPQGYLIKPNYSYRGMQWLLLPLLVFLGAYLAWRRWGKDEEVTIKAEYYPPVNVSPSISGYIIDDRLNRRDLTALVPYWGAGGYLQVKEIADSALFGLIKTKDYQFIKLKELPAEAMTFEHTLFNGIFRTGHEVMLKDLKDVLYKDMAEAKKDIEREIDRSEYYVKGSRGLGIFFILLGIGFGFLAFISFQNGLQDNLFKSIAFIASGIIMIIFGLFMSKKTRKGTELYQHLAGFREFVKSVEQDRLREFLKQDEHYFDKILPYAIVFNVADTWKDKLEGLDIPPPTWYHGNYATFSTYNFMSSLNRSMNSMSDTFYSSPKSSGSSGGSWGGGGSSGGGFGGGGGSSW